MNLDRRVVLKSSVALAGATAFSFGPAFAQAKGGIINVATVGEPPTLDPMVSTADLVGIITQHFFETLYTFDKDWKVTPLLAASMPEVTEGGKVYTIKLREGIKFHDGSDMTSEDVVASLKRWMEQGSRGKQVAGNRRQARSRRSLDRASHPEGRPMRLCSRCFCRSTTPRLSSCRRRRWTFR